MSWWRRRNRCCCWDARPRERLASFLLAQSRQGMPRGQSSRQFSLPMPRVDIADHLGLTIETVSRTLTQMRVEVLIDIGSQNGIVICDPIALEGMAGGLPRSPILASVRSSVADQHVALRRGAGHLPRKSSAREGRKEATCLTTF